MVTVLALKTWTSFPIYAEIPVSASPAVTNGSSPGILSSLFKRLPLVDLPKSTSRLYSPHSTLASFALSEAFIFPGVRPRALRV